MKKLREGFEEEVSLDCKNSIELLFKSDNLEYIKWLEKRIKALTILEVNHRRELLLSVICEYNKINTQKEIIEVEKWIEKWHCK